MGTAVTEPSLTSPHGAVSEPHAHALAHLGDLAPLGVCFLEQALQLASSLDTLSSGAEQECKVSFCFLPTICFQTVFSGCTENFPKLTQNTERENGSIPTQEAQRWPRPAVNRPAFVMLPVVRLAFSPSGSPKSRGHVAHHSPHHPGQSHPSSKVSARIISNFFPPARPLS